MQAQFEQFHLIMSQASTSLIQQKAYCVSKGNKFKFNITIMPQFQHQTNNNYWILWLRGIKLALTGVLKEPLCSLDKSVHTYSTCPHLTNLQHNNANPFHDSQGDSNIKNRLAVMWDGNSWMRSLLCNWLCYCSLSQYVNAGITHTGLLLISQTSMFGEKPWDPPNL